MFNTRHNRIRKQTGSSLVLVLLFLLVLSAAAMGLMYGSNIDTLVSSNYKQSLQAYYASKDGLEEARDRIRLGALGGNPNGIVPPTTQMPSSVPPIPTGVIYITNPDDVSGAIQPWIYRNGNTPNKYYDDELCHENFAGLPGLTSTGLASPCTGTVTGSVYYTAIPSIDPNTGTAAAIPYKWVRITLKQVGTTNPWCTDGTCTSVPQSTQVCADSGGNEIPLPAAISAGGGDCDTANMKPVYTLTSMAMTTTGARRITQQEIANITVPPLPGALILDGRTPAPNFQTPNSLNYVINGNNLNSCGRVPPGANLTAVGTTSNTDVTNVDSMIPSNRTGNYVGTDGVTPDVENVESKLGLWQTVGGIEQITTDLETIADQCSGIASCGGLQTQTCAVSGLGCWGTPTNPQITVIYGDYSGPCEGYGILLVTGALTCNGAYNWTGEVLVIGKGYVNALNGGGAGQITGGVLVANLYNHLCGPGDASCTQSALLPPSSLPGTDYFNWSGGGGNGLRYDACEMSIMDNKIGYHILVTREEMY